MKRAFKTLVLCCAAAAALLGVSCRSESSASDSELSGELSLSGAFALYPLAVQWAAEFQQMHPAVHVDISAGGAGKGMTDALAGVVDFGMVSREVYPPEIEKGAVGFAVAKDAVAPTINTANPKLTELLERGLSREAAIKIWVTGEAVTWGDVLGTDDPTPLHAYTRSDACGAAETWAMWLDTKQEELCGTAVFGDPGVAAAVQKDIYGIGLNNIGYIYDNDTHLPNEGIMVLPVDADGDGRIDPDERFYDTMESFVEAIAADRYPSPPARDLYLVTRGVPTSPVVIAFLEYVLSEGQRLTVPSGYIGVSQAKIDAQLKLLHGSRSHRHHDAGAAGVHPAVWILSLLAAAALLAMAGMLFARRDLKARILREKTAGAVMLAMTGVSLLLVIGMAVGLYLKSTPILAEHSLWELLSASEWRPSKNSFGFFPFIMGTVWVTGIALLLALPLSLLTAVFLTEYAKSWIKRWVYPALDILAALPSVIYGVWGTLLIVPWISEKLAPHFVDFSSGYTVLAGGIVLSVMVLPLLVSLFVELFSTVPQELRDSSKALGATRWQTAKKVVVKKSLPGIFAAVVLAVSRALGETIAVLMVCGNLPETPRSLLDACYPIPALIANNYGEMLSVPLYEAALMFAALILFVVVLVFNLASRIILYRLKKSAF